MGISNLEGAMASNSHWSWSPVVLGESHCCGLIAALACWGEAGWGSKAPTRGAHPDELLNKRCWGKGHLRILWKAG